MDKWFAEFVVNRIKRAERPFYSKVLPGIGEIAELGCDSRPFMAFLAVAGRMLETKAPIVIFTDSVPYEAGAKMRREDFKDGVAFWELVTNQELGGIDESDPYYNRKTQRGHIVWIWNPDYKAIGHLYNRLTSLGPIKPEALDEALKDALDGPHGLEKHDVVFYCYGYPDAATGLVYLIKGLKNVTKS